MNLYYSSSNSTILLSYAVTCNVMLEPSSISEPGASSSNLAISDISISAIAYSESGNSISSILISKAPSLLGMIVNTPSLSVKLAISVLLRCT